MNVILVMSDTFRRDNLKFIITLLFHVGMGKWQAGYDFLNQVPVASIFLDHFFDFPRVNVHECCAGA